jgi:PKD domain-containing protein
VSRKILIWFALFLVGAMLFAGQAQALPPHAAFSYKPETPLSGVEVKFTSESTVDPTDPTRTIVEESWDLDDDGSFDDASGSTATWTFDRPGTKRVELHVTDSLGETDTKSHHVQVVNRPPVAVLVLAPTAPAAGQPVALVSNSYDPDGSIVATDWDLDGDGAYDDATGSYVTRAFGAGGWVIGLRVKDSSGAYAFAVATLDIKGTSVPGSGPGPGSATVISGLRLMSPFPIVRVAGVRRARGTKLSLLSVNAPVGAMASVRCSGRGCPFKRASKSIKAPSRSARAAATTGLVRFRSFARRLLRPGAILRVFVTRPGEIGKYTRLRIRRNKFPARADRCVTPDGLVPLACPAG